MNKETYILSDSDLELNPFIKKGFLIISSTLILFIVISEIGRYSSSLLSYKLLTNGDIIINFLFGCFLLYLTSMISIGIYMYFLNIKDYISNKIKEKKELIK